LPIIGELVRIVAPTAVSAVALTDGCMYSACLAHLPLALPLAGICIVAARRSRNVGTIKPELEPKGRELPTSATDP